MYSSFKKKKKKILLAHLNILRPIFDSIKDRHCPCFSDASTHLCTLNHCTSYFDIMCSYKFFWLLLRPCHCFWKFCIFISTIFWCISAVIPPLSPAIDPVVFCFFLIFSLLYVTLFLPLLYEDHSYSGYCCKLTKQSFFFSAMKISRPFVNRFKDFKRYFLHSLFS